MKHLLFLFATLFLAQSAAAQDVVTRETDDGKAAKFYDKATDLIRERSYARAEVELDKVLAESPNHIDAILDKAAILYTRAELARAEALYARAYALRPDHEQRTAYFLAEAQYRQQKFDDAITHFNAYLAQNPKSEKLRKRATDFLKSAEFARVAIRDPQPFDPQPLPPTINTPGPEYLPTLSADGNSLLYTRVVRGQEDFYISYRQDSTWTEGVPIEGLNTPDNEGAQTITADGNYLVFTACNRPGGVGSCDLWFSERRDGRWTPPAPLGTNINTRGWESQPCLTADGKYLYFAAKRQDGYGGSDLYVALRRADGTWSQPLNLGETINTPQDDESPFIHPDGQTLYFMSKGHPGMGGFDLYYSRRDPKGIWQTPENLGYPINTTGSEGALFISLDGSTGFFASDRTDFRPGDSAFDRPDGGAPTDIYQFELPERLRPQPVTYVRARVFDADTRQPLDAFVSFFQLPNDDPYVESQTGPPGTFLVTLPRQSDYALNVSASGYLFHSENFALTDSTTQDDPYELDIYLQPIVVAGTKPELRPTREPVVLRNVFFEIGSAELLPTSTRELDRLFALLEANPELRIQLNGHTDNVGSEADNQSLSERRAAAVRQYLIGKGIAANRLEAKGFGESRPVAENETAGGRRLNRRTEFEVL